MKVISILCLLFVSSVGFAKSYKCRSNSQEVKSFFKATDVKYQNTSKGVLVNVDIASCYSFDNFAGLDILSCSLNDEAGILIEQGKKKGNGLVLSLVTGDMLDAPMDCKL